MQVYVPQITLSCLSFHFHATHAFLDEQSVTKFGIMSPYHLSILYNIGPQWT
jgi:hypothetical protein